MTNDERDAATRILVVDDTAAVHADFRKLLTGANPPAAELDQLEASLFGSRSASVRATFEVESALQGEQGLELAKRALAEGRPFAMAFVDMRMPPGWDGLQTIEALWQAQSDLEIVICTAYADYSDDEIIARLGGSDQLLVLKKPFDAIEVRQLARALTEKWRLRQHVRVQLAELERTVAARARELSTASLLVVAEMSRRAAIELELEALRKTGSLGQLARGVAQEMGIALSDMTRSLDHALSLASPEPTELRDELARLSRAMRREATRVRGLERLAADAPVARATLDIPRVLEAIVEIMHESILYCAALDTHLDPIPLVECSAADVSSVFLGLIDNAVRAIATRKRETGEHGRLSITTSVEGDWASVAITDTGAPVPQASRATLFAPFGGGGSGALGERRGLSAAWSIIVEEHGGGLDVMDAAGATTFVVRLPLRSGTAPTPTLVAT